jgi:hypothetical protein
LWDTPGVMVKTKGRLPSGPAMTAHAFRSCAACLHAIVEPAVPLLVDGRFFHPGHQPAESELEPRREPAALPVVRFVEVADDLEVFA